MTRYLQLLCDVWREACKHIKIEEWVDSMAPMLAGPLGADVVLVRHADVQERWIETMAVGRCRPGPVPTLARAELTSRDVQNLLAWSQRREVVHLTGRERAPLPPAVVPSDLEGEVLVGPLVAPSGAFNMLVLATEGPGRFQPRQVELAFALLEPFSVALENDRRLRELESLREAVEAENRSLLSKLGRHDISDSIVGSDTGLKAVMEEVEKVARSDAPVLILGETGTGKEVVARAIHAGSQRARGPFLRVNCGAIPPDLVDSELFGHEKGSFTGAVGERRGWFERASGGTLFLDECGELPLAAQVRLLRVLQDGVLERVGGERPIHVDVRIVAATHRDLHVMTLDGRFRQDLWYRIAVFPIRLPPLRERLSDIHALTAHFALRAARRLGMPPLSPTADDIHLLISYDWPGNIRELAAVIERAAILGNGTCLEIARALGMRPDGGPMPSHRQVPTDSPSPDGKIASLDAAIARHIEAALIQTRGRVEGPHGAAALLQINPHTLRARMRKLKVDWRRYRASDESPRRS